MCDSSDAQEQLLHEQTLEKAALRQRHEKELLAIVHESSNEDEEGSDMGVPANPPTGSGVVELLKEVSHRQDAAFLRCRSSLLVESANCLCEVVTLGGD